MDENQRIFLWILAGFGLFGCVGACFGGIVGLWTHADGRTAGTILGRTVVDAFARMNEAEMSPLRRAILTGAVDGAAFLAVVGGVLGGVVAWRFPVPAGTLWPAILAVAGLPLLATGFGVLALGLTRLGVRAVGWICTGSLGGAILGFRLFGNHGLMIGLLLGLLLGFCGAWWVRR